MNQREKIMAGVIVVLVGFWIAKTGYEKATSHYDQRAALRDNLQKQVRDAKYKTRRGRRAEKRLREWRKSSLAEDHREGRAQYQQWLRHCAEEAKIEDVQVDSKPRITRREGFNQLAFTVRGNASLKEVTQFLYQFYRADTLHKISRLHLAPKPGSKSRYGLSVTILALSVEGAKPTDRSEPRQSDRPQHGDLASYQETIGDRALFSEYVPPKPPRPPRVVRERPRPTPPKPPAFDEAKHTVMTAVTSKSGVPRAWFRVRTSGEMLKLAVGDRLEVGSVSAEVVNIYLRQVELATDEDRLLLDLGESLNEALVLPRAGS